MLTWLWLTRHGGDLSGEAWRRCSDASKKWFQRVTALLEVVDDRPPLEFGWIDRPIDAWDAPIWTAAKRGGAQFVITENLKDGPPPDAEGLQSYQGVCFIHPEHFLSLLDYLADVDESAALANLADSFPHPRRLEQRAESAESEQDRWIHLDPRIRATINLLLERRLGSPPSELT